jgi:hypothetical protein
MNNPTIPKLRHEMIMFFVMLKDAHNICFHPDTPFSDYVNEAGSPVFSEEEAELLEMDLDLYLEYCVLNNMDIYVIAMQALTFDPQFN